MIVGVVLAGGRATRMGGGDKPLVLLAGRPLLAHVLDRIAPQVDAVAINANGPAGRFAAFGLPVLPDPVPGQPGPLAGLLAGLDWAAARGADGLVTAPGDAPFLPPDLVARLRAAWRDTGRPAYVVSEGPGGTQAHPITALWPTSLAPALRAALAAGERRVRVFADAAAAVTVAFPAAGLRNVNTPADLADAEAELARR